MFVIISYVQFKFLQFRSTILVTNPVPWKYRIIVYSVEILYLILLDIVNNIAC